MHDRSNPYNKKHEPHGLWFNCYENGNYEYKGLYTNGKMHGSWEWYWANGKLSSKGTFNMGHTQGFWTWYHENGKIDETMFYAR